MASKSTVGTPNTLGKVWNIDVEREYRKLSYLFQNPERNNGIITESLRQLKMFVHQQSSKMRLYCFFGENLSEFEIAWEVIGLLLELLQNVMKQKDEGFAKVVWIQIANLIKIVFSKHLSIVAFQVERRSLVNLYRISKQEDPH